MGLHLNLVLTSPGQAPHETAHEAELISQCMLSQNLTSHHHKQQQSSAWQCVVGHSHFQLLTMPAASYLDPLQAHLYLPALTVCDSIADLMPFQNLILTEDLMRAS